MSKLQPAVTLSLRISTQIRDCLEELSDATGRTKSFLAAEAIHQYLSTQAWQVKAIKRAIQKADSIVSLTHFFPTPQNILAADLSSLGLTTAKSQTLKALAQAVDDGTLILDGTDDYEVTCKKLLTIKGIGRWTVQYIAMRGLRNPDAFPETDLEIQKKIKSFDLNPELWVPWRAYAAILLFNL